MNNDDDDDEHDDYDDDDDDHDDDDYANVNNGWRPCPWLYHTMIDLVVTPW